MASRPVPQGQQTQAAVVADKWLRVAGYFIDVVPALVLGLVALIPIVGLIFAGLLLAPYWLLRDLTGASLGKLVLGMRVVGQNGQPASKGALMGRNLPLIAAPICMMVPFLGYFLFAPVALIVVLVEAIMLLSQRSRLGDKMAGTVVVRKAASPALAAAAGNHDGAQAAAARQLSAVNTVALPDPPSKSTANSQPTSPVPTIRFCPGCGKAVKSEDQFCQHCGAARANAAMA